MLYCLEKPVEQLQDILAKLDRTHESCNDYYYTECDYIYSKMENKEEFIKCLTKAIEMIQEANDYVKK